MSKNIFFFILIAFISNSNLFSQENFTPKFDLVGDGLTGYYYQGYFIDSTGAINCDSLTLSFSRTDTIIDFWDGSRYFNWQPVSGWGDYYSVDWKGYIYIQETGEYGFGTISDDGSQIFIDSIMIVDNGELQWYDWEDNISEGDTSGTPFPPLVLDSGFHHISIRFYENASYDGIEFWWLKTGIDSSDIPYYGTNFHGTPPTYNDSTNWELVPKTVLFTNIDSLVSIDYPVNGKQIPTAFKIHQNYPNPFNNSTIFKITVPENGSLQLRVFDITGQKIYEQNIGDVLPAVHKIKWNGLSDSGNHVASGVYFYRFIFEGNNSVKNIQTRKMTLLR